MKKPILACLVLALGAPLWANAQQPAYLDPSQPMEKRVDDLIQRLSPDEKTSLLSTTAPAIERLKIPAMNGWNQSLHGIVWTKPTTMFPVPISMAATWDPTLVHEVAAACHASTVAARVRPPLDALTKERDGLLTEGSRIRFAGPVC